MATPYKDRQLNVEPAMNVGDKAYFDAAAEGKLLLKKCGDCGKHHHYPRAICPHCFSSKVDWTEARGSGTIYSCSMTRRGGPIPYCIAYVQLEDLGFCKKGEGGKFVADGNLISGSGKLPFNTDGGGLCNNHPGNRGGMTKVIEAVRQLRGEASVAVQVPDCELALAHGNGGSLGTRSAAATLILGRADA